MLRRGTYHSRPISWIPLAPDVYASVRSPAEIKYALAVKTAMSIDLKILENSIARIIGSRTNVYSRAEINTFVINLDGTVRGQKEQLINWIIERHAELIPETDK